MAKSQFNLKLHSQKIRLTKELPHNGSLITYVLMPDHFHLISNPEDGRIKEFCGQLKAIAAKTMVQTTERFEFRQVELGHQVWQESFKAFPVWSERLIWQKINYVHANPVKARLVKSAKDYYWSGFRSFHGMGDEPLAIDSEWWWPDDAEKFRKAVMELSEEERRSLKGIDVT